MAQQRRGGRKRRKVDYIAANHIEHIDYKDIELLKRFISERGKILPRRVIRRRRINRMIFIDKFLLKLVNFFIHRRVTCYFIYR